MTAREEMRGALKPTCDALVQAAAIDAAAILAAADSDADQELPRAQADAGRRLAAAREGGERDAHAAADTEQRQAQRAGRQLLLRAQREAYEEVGRRVREAAQELRTDPRYGQLLEGLTAAAVDRLGPQASITEGPSGGILGELGARHVDLSLDTLADLALAGCPTEVGALWQP